MHQLPHWLASLDRNGVVAGALSATVDQSMRDGRPWCPRAVAAGLIALVAERDTRLTSAIQRCVLLARILHRIDGGEYWRPLYRIDGHPQGLPRLTSTAFAQLCRGLRDSGFIVDQGAVTVSGAAPATSDPDASVPLSGGARASADAAVIPFQAMPLLAAVLRLLHDALGLAVVGDALAPALQPTWSPEMARDAGSQLARLFDAWLTEHLDTSHQMRQARVIRAFLRAEDCYRSSAIDDALVLRFWQEQAKRSLAADLDGFRLFTSAARKLILYREQLRRQEVHSEIAAAVPLEDWNESSNADPVAADAAWSSPLLALGRPPAGYVKWLTLAERRRLQNYIGADADAPDGDAPLRRPSRGGASIGLAPGGPFDLSLALTLLRADLFGDVQGRIVQSLRDGASGNSRIDDELGAIAAGAYADLHAGYRRVGAQVRDGMRAALFPLASSAAGEAVLLLAALGEREALAEIQAHVRHRRVDDVSADADAPANDKASPPIGDRVGSLLQAAARERPPPELAALAAAVDRARRAFRSIRRQGFDDLMAKRDPAAFLAAVDPLLSLDRQLMRLDDALSARIAAFDPEADAVIFGDTFRSLYGDGAA